MMIAAPSLDEIWWGSAIGQEPQPATWFPGLGPDNEVASFDFGDNEPPTGFMPHLALTVTLDEPAMQSFPHTRDVVRFFRALSSYVKGTVNLRFGPLFDPQE